jgi:hypothetical protein
MNMPNLKRTVNGLLAGLFGSLLCLSSTARAQLVESEPNDTAQNAQLLCFAGAGVTITAAIGSGATTSDLDIFAFDAESGDAPSLQVTSDGSWNPLMVFYDETGHVLNQSDDVYVPAYSTDPAIGHSALSASGRYFVAVAASPNYLGDNFAPFNPGTSATGGTYTLTISGVSTTTTTGIDGETASDGSCNPVTQSEPEPLPPAEEPVVTQPSTTSISMEVLHWRDKDPEISKLWQERMERATRQMIVRHGVHPVPVVMFTSASFDATDVDPKSLTFGRTGEEDSLFRCSRRGRDVNKDGKKDMVCFFDTFKAGFEVGDVQAHLNGETRQGEAFTSSASLKAYKVWMGNKQ